MIVTSAQVADTLRLLVPGFILTRIFYTFGLKTKRSDALWVVWSIIATVPIGALATTIARGRLSAWEVEVGVAIAVFGGAALAAGWRMLVRFAPNLTAEAAIRAWDVILGQSRWVQVETRDGRTFVGRNLYAARSVDTDDQDLYLIEPQCVQDGKLVDLTGVQGILLTRKEIAYIVVFGTRVDDTSPGGDDEHDSATSDTHELPAGTVNSDNETRAPVSPLTT